MINKKSKIYIAGHTGLAGSAIVEALQKNGYNNLLLRTHQELDLSRQNDVEAFFKKEKPDFVILAAAKVGGILANQNYPADFIYINLMIELNVLRAAYESGVKNLLFFGSSCIYPTHCPQPIKESYLLTGPLEPSNEPYAIAKIAGIKTCQSFNKQYGTRYLAIMPCNLYGPSDNYDLNNSHVLPALMRKFHEAKMKNEKAVVIWGSGQPRREFLHSHDLADACLFLMRNESFWDFDPQSLPLLNIGSGSDITIADLAFLIRDIVGFKGEILYDNSKPDGTPQKLLDSSSLFNSGWRPKRDLESGIKLTYETFTSGKFNGKF